jgi:GNAT superfamily N-acetyltransferase
LNQTTPSVEVRAAAKNDADALARLAGELGYPSTPAQVRERLAAVEGQSQHATYIAVDQSGGIVGWIELAEIRSLAHDARAEITGLVVDAAHRGAGVGRLLVQRGEAWARERGLSAIGVRSNVIRDRAHAFYLGLGYAVAKSQKVFRKAL